jgi:hypothetical protein
MKKRRWGDLLWDLWIYFKMGHSGYLGFIINIANFIVIQYVNVILGNPLLTTYFGSMMRFLLLFIVTYIPTAVIIGYIGIKKGENVRRTYIDPFTQSFIEFHLRLISGITLYTEGKTEEAQKQLDEGKTILLQWIEEDYIE